MYIIIFITIILLILPVMFFYNKKSIKNLLYILLTTIIFGDITLCEDTSQEISSYTNSLFITCLTTLILFIIYKLKSQPSDIILSKSVLKNFTNFS